MISSAAIAVDERGADVPRRHPAVRVEHEDGVVLHAADHEAEARFGRAAVALGVAQEARVLDGERGALGDGPHELEVALVEAAAGLGHDERERAEDGAAHLERHDDVGAELQLVDQAQMLFVDDSFDEELAWNLGHQLGVAGAQHVIEAVGVVGPRRIASLEIVDERHLARIDVGDGDSCRLGAAAFDEIDRAPVGDGRHGQARHGGERALVVERGAQLGVGAQEEAAILVIAGPLGDLAEDADGVRDRAGGVAHRHRSQLAPALLGAVDGAEADSLFDAAAREGRAAAAV